MHCLVIALAPLFFTPLIYTADENNGKSLATYIQAWPAVIFTVQSTGNNCNIDGITAYLQKTAEFTMKSIRMYQRPYTRSHFLLKQKTTNNSEIELCEFANRLTARNCTLNAIGMPLPIAISPALNTIHLDHNALTSFDEIQRCILDVCCNLSRLNVSHNKLNGALNVSHHMLQDLDLSHNQLILVETITLPNIRSINLQSNNIQCIMAKAVPANLNLSFNPIMSYLRYKIIF